MSARKGDSANAGETQLVGYIVTDPDQEEFSGEGDLSHVESWQDLYETAYEKELRDPESGLDYASWNSSFTGEAYPLEVMTEWRANTVNRLVDLPHDRVLEVGCGTGLILADLAIGTSRYVATDISPSALDACKQLMSERQPLNHVELIEARADDYTRIPEGPFDLIVLNSVIQYFPNAAYLAKVLSALSGRLADGGSIFVGDVRDSRLLECFHSDVAMQRQHGVKPETLEGQVLASVAREEELTVNPAWFADFVKKESVIEHLIMAPRLDRHMSEMALYRYDVILSKEDLEKVPAFACSWAPCDLKSVAPLSQIAEILKTTRTPFTVISGFPDTRLNPSLENWRKVSPVAEKTNRLTAERREYSVTLDSLLELAKRYDLELYILLSDKAGYLNVVFGEPGSKLSEIQFPAHIWLNNDTRSNVPNGGNLKPNQIRQIRQALSEYLPEHMVPISYIGISRIPLTASGKVNRKALPTISGALARAEYQAPSGEAEIRVAATISDLLGAGQVGSKDSFFELGGNSLIAVQLASRLESATGKQVALKDVFECPTVEALAERLEARGSGLTRAKIDPVDRTLPVPLSFQQERLWRLERQDKRAQEAHLIGSAYRVNGSLNTAILRKAFLSLVDRHEVLRTVFYENDQGDLCQIIRSTEAVGVAFRVEDVGQLSEAALGRRVEDLLQEPVDLANGPLFRVSLLQSSEALSILVIASHQIVLGERSLGKLLLELSALINSDDAGRDSLSLQYADYASWQRKSLVGDEFEANKSWWRDELVGLPEVISLPFDRSRGQIADPSCDVVPFSVNTETATALRALADKHGATLFMVLETALASLLSRIGAGNDIAIGTSASSRMRKELAGVCGNFSNTVVIRNRINIEQTFLQQVQSTRRVVQNAFAHEIVPFETIVPVLTLNHVPLAQVLLDVRKADDSGKKLMLGNAQLEPLKGIDIWRSTHDLVFKFYEDKHNLSGRLYFRKQLFERQTAEKIAMMLKRLLDHVAGRPETCVVDLPIMSDRDKAQVTSGFNSGVVEFPEDLTIVDLFQKQVNLNPSSTAIIDRERQITYRDLDDASNRLARYLIGLGIGFEAPVGVCLDRSPELVIALLAIMKAGGAYLPLDPDYPQDRLDLMLEDAGAKWVIMNRKQETALPVLSANPMRKSIILSDPAVAVAIAEHTPQTLNDNERLAPLNPQSLAYLIYTSGSTGRPKGSLLPHHNVVRLLKATEERFQFGQDDVWSCFHSCAFDFSVWEMWGALCTGGKAVIVPRTVARTPEAFASLLQQAGVTVLNQTPTAFDGLTRVALENEFLFPDLRLVIFGGEALEPRKLKPWFDRFGDAQPKLVNMYGITETTVHVTWAQLTRESLKSGASGIGMPIQDLCVYVLDAHLEPVPVGVPGEMFVGGAGLCRGYLKRSDLTAERFVADPFSGNQGSRLYRTGDLARWRPDGTLEYLGRIDTQTKIRGMRVELGEIEAALMRQPGISHAVVALRKSGTNTDTGAILVAYVVLPGTAEVTGRATLVSAGQTAADTDFAGVGVLSLEGLLDIGGLRTELARELPDHMVPVRFIGISHLPMTPSGKVDRNALPQVEGDVARAKFEPPESDTERLVASAFAELLGTEEIGRHDEFFVLGGNSLSAVRFATRMVAATGKAVGARDIFESPTVAELAALIDSRKAEIKTVPLVPVDRSQFIPLSYQQERMWFLDRIDNRAGFAYHIEGAFQLDGDFDPTALDFALARLVARHEALRTVFAVDEAGMPFQVILPPPVERWGLVVEDGSSFRDTQLKAHVSKLLGRKFDLEQGPLFRAHVIRQSADRHILLIGGHHSVLDGWSIGIIVKELAALYAEARGGKPANLSSLPVQYPDYAIWQRSELSDTRLRSENAWWKAHLEGIPDAISLPFDRPRPETMDFSGGAVRLHVSKDLTRSLKRLAQSNDATLFMVLEAAFACVLARLGAGNDIVIGTAVAGRPRHEVEGLAGYFVNTVALRNRVDLENSFLDQLRATRSETLNALSHGYLPFETVVDAVSPVRSLSHPPLMQVMLLLQNTPDSGQGLSFGGTDVTHFELPHRGTARTELGLDLEETPNGLIGRLIYSLQVFELATAERIAGMFTRFLEQIAKEPGVKVGITSVLQETERKRLLSDFNSDEIEPLKEVAFLDRFAEQVRSTPDRMAVHDGKLQLTFRDLDTKSNRLARHFIKLGVCPERPVAVCLARSSSLIIAMLATLKAGGAYLPLDPDYPIERLSFMLNDAGAQIIVTNREVQASNGSLFVQADVDTLVLDEPQTQGLLSEYEDTPLEACDQPAKTSEDRIAYIIYTSGSTGKPKGVMVSVSNISRYISWLCSATQYIDAPAMLMSTTIGFDMGIRELLLPLARGGSLHCFPENVLRCDFSQLAAVKATAFVGTPLLLEAILDVADDAWLSRIEFVYCGGAPLSAHLSERAQSLMKNAELRLGYGPTEGTCNVTSVLFNDIDSDQGIPIGSPIIGTRVYVLDPYLEPAPTGVPGELFIGGGQVSRGYAGKPGLTAEKFIADPFCDAPGMRIYRSGDLARWKADGSLEFLGRIDNQVKIRGMRVELEEIEGALASIDGIARAIVEPDSDVDSPQLTAFLVPELVSDEQIAQALEKGVQNLSSEDRSSVVVLPVEECFDHAALRQRLRQELPEHMVPTGFVALSRLPMTASGKIDRKGLPNVQVSLAHQPYEQPITNTEMVVAEVFAELLGCSPVGRHDSFFELGGHSLSALRLVARLQTLTGKAVVVRHVFEAPTVAGLSVRIDAAQTVADDTPIVCVNRSQPLPLSYQQERLWFLDRLDSRAGAAYHTEGAFRLKGPLDVNALRAALFALVDRHEELRTVFVDHGQGTPCQIIRPVGESGFTAELEDCSGQTESQLEERIASLLARPFNLETGPLFRSSILRLSDEEHVLITGGHHIILDGWSHWLLFKELGALYHEAKSGAPSNLPELPIQYADYASWQRNTFSGAQLDREIAWWKDELSGLPTAIELPFDRPRPEVMDFKGDMVRLSVPNRTLNKLKKLGVQNGATLFMILETAFATMLSRLGAGEDFAIGTAVAGRPRQELEGLCGFFVNTVAIRNRLDLQRTFSEQLNVARGAILDAFAHPNTPFELVVDKVVTDRTLGCPPLVQATCVLQNLPDAGKSFNLEGVQAEPLLQAVKAETAKFELSLDLMETSRGLSGLLAYSSQVFDAETVTRLASMYVRILEVVADVPETVLIDIPLTGQHERDVLTEGFNNVDVFYPRDATISDLVARQCQVQPTAIAVTGPDRYLTYAQLEAETNRLARYLIGKNVGPETVVGVCAERSCELIVTLLAILKAGGAYLPLDPDYPEDRLALMIKDAGAKLLVTYGISNPGLVHIAHSDAVELVALDRADTLQAVSEQSELPIGDDERTLPVGPDSLAYIIYTSGSTGTPKGSPIAHHNVVRLLRATQDWYGFGREDVWTFFHSYAFDFSVWEIWGCLSTGGRLVVVPRHVARSPEAFAELVQDNNVSVLNQTPTAFGNMSQVALDRGMGMPALRLVIFGGEALEPRTLQPWFDRFGDSRPELVNMYGITETTVHVTYQPVKEGLATAGASVIGVPIPDQRVYVLDQHMQLAPIGVPGEMYVGGEGLCRGYLGRSGLTAQRFVADPFSRTAGARLYRTGDLAKWRADGLLEFMGRIDSQVKIRGMRVELGEIEAALSAQDGIAQAVVSARSAKDGGGKETLVAYVVTDPGSLPEPMQDNADAQVQSWKDLYETTYDESVSDEETGLNFIGWNSSFTGEAYSLEAMKEWRSNTLDRLKFLPHQRVLEIGCGTGLLMSGLAPSAERYVGADFSCAALSTCRSTISSREDLAHVELIEARADESDKMPDGPFDLIILNSVIQYFPSAGYLHDVLNAALPRLAKGGAIYVGDVRDFRLLECFHAHVAVSRSQASTDPASLQGQLLVSMARENELTLDPAWFQRFAEAHGDLDHAAVSPRIDKHPTEMGLFRYDVVLLKDRTSKRHLDDDILWLEGKSLRSIEDYFAKEAALSDASGKNIGVKEVEDTRLAEALANWRRLDPGAAVRRERSAPGQTDGVTLDACEALASKFNRALLVQSCSKPGCFDLVFATEPRSLAGYSGFRAHQAGEWTMANNPNSGTLTSSQIRQVRDALLETLPEHMVPGNFVGLARLPLTPSGKVNRKVLPEVDGAMARAEYQPPATPTEELVAKVIAELLQVDRLGREDSFFELGGHSLSAVRLIARLVADTEKPIVVRDVFENPTVCKLAERLESLSSSPPDADAIEMLRANEDLADEFDEVFGLGAAKRVLRAVA
ncbi:non-ribosomal peptide synthetase [Roseibium sp. RKSG952]|uniref:non-ribosomal peptide synthetase n=1 Tax=Roseibium sp. RKSG952 TaxID=2529384 RepID=UPI001AD8E050